MVFLPGEVVVDYSLRLKREFDRSRLWVNAYSNDNPCYIPSERILKEGGYEGGGAMVYYDRPTKLAAGVEQKIIDEVHRQLPENFRAPEGTEGVAPRSPEASLRSIRTKSGLEVELVAAEPLVTSPVAIDWGTDGRLWVCEMFDYPMGTDQNWQPGGRVKCLADRDGDGRYDDATIFLENLPFPTGVTAWGRGVLVCAAPDIIYAQDTDGDGRADKVEKLFSGFATDNYQARVNSLSLGLDNWIYGANGLLGGIITGKHGSLDIRNRDFRFRAVQGPMEPVTGLTQQGRVRDDWGRWFGCDNGNPLFHYPHEERYLRRNPHVTMPAPTVRPKANFDVGRVYPISRTLERFNDPDNTNRMTSACGLGLYRDVLLGEQYADNAFVCEPVHNLVHRMIISGDDPGMTQRRADDEKESEFLASTDNWFRPVQVRTGPDGALYVVDMYRFLIEHPRWIPAKRLAELDVRAGSDKGRIYRIRAKGTTLRRVRDLTKLSGGELAGALDTPNGTERDRVHVELLARHDAVAAPVLERLATGATMPQVRVQALAALEGLDALTLPVLERALGDAEARVRQHAVRLCDSLLEARESPDMARIAEALLRLRNDPSGGVRRQLAYTLGHTGDRRAGEAIAMLAVRHIDDSGMRLAVLSSAVPHCRAILAAVGAADAETTGRTELLAGIVATAAASGDATLLAQAVAAVVPRSGATPDERTFRMLASLLGALHQKAEVSAHVQQSVRETVDAARRIANDDARPVTLRTAAIELLAWGDGSAEGIESLCRLVVDADPVRTAAVSALRRRDNAQIAERLLAAWPRLSPSVRTQVTGLLLGREGWSAAMLQAVKQGRVRPNEIPLADQQRLLRSADDVVRLLAAGVFTARIPTKRDEVIARYRSVASLPGNASRGRELFAANCSACHAMGGVGHDVAPSLTTLHGKDVDYFVKNILDPSAIVEPRFVSYDVTLMDRRLVSGIIRSETAAALTIQSGGGSVETVPRSLVKEIRASKLSMMPEGFEEALAPQEMADVLAFLKQHSTAPDKPASAAPAAGEDVARDPAAVAKVILDPKLSDAAREAAVAANPQFAAELIVEMTRDLVPGTKAEYERIPWIWRVAVACGRRNDLNQMKRVLAMSVPEMDKPLLDWQAVVIGGGIINGISERGQWPGPRIEAILRGDEALQNRYRRSLDLASAMTDDEKVPTPTRYDALRMLGVEPWEKRGDQLVRYLAKGVHPELQQGAVSGVADVNDPDAAAALILMMEGFTESNCNLAIEGLLRDEARVTALLDVISNGMVKRRWLRETHVKKLLEHPNPKLRERAASVLKSAA
jgi:putative membrane-bound dehydrogenase-like protein